MAQDGGPLASLKSTSLFAAGVILAVKLGLYHNIDHDCMYGAYADVERGSWYTVLWYLTVSTWVAWASTGAAATMHSVYDITTSGIYSRVKASGLSF